MTKAEVISKFSHDLVKEACNDQYNTLIGILHRAQHGQNVYAAAEEIENFFHEFIEQSNFAMGVVEALEEVE